MNSPWLIGLDAKPEARLTLVCFGSSGSGAIQFRAWNRQTPDWLRVAGVQLPGREARFREAPWHDLGALATAIADALGEQLTGPFACYGHSFGALLAFEVCRQLRRTGSALPQLLAVAGRWAPQLPHPYRKTYHLPDAEFIEVLAQYGGTDRRILADAELMRLFLPGIRADLELNTEYVYPPEPPLPLPLIALRGDADPVCSPPELAAWQAQTTAGFSLHTWQGGHFFEKAGQELVLGVVVEALGRGMVELASG
ncbi:thioesterase II family protein [Parachitinimonas caeni]|uniref:Thioesterase domain-containing protein n=1 Tax=Parachitinimonas caeni TaxID=3031301 RepID=A0ABT7DUI8_9NEIS|nr:alpha/beta fold hydrolase [Parachitinimonas caeni]MDK2122753.1 thioesterase domain-containing protein [Parachitinimonas caeni]